MGMEFLPCLEVLDAIRFMFFLKQRHSNFRINTSLLQDGEGYVVGATFTRQLLRLMIVYIAWFVNSVARFVGECELYFPFFRFEVDVAQLAYK